MSENTIAIDFGTSRTKAAYFDPETQQPELMRLGKDLSIPSYFNLDLDSEEIWIGDEARERLEGNPKGHMPRLKMVLQKAVRCGKRKVEPKALLKMLFSEIRERAGQIPCFDNVPPTAVQLTFTYVNPQIERKLLEAAAQAAGFKTVELVPEPEAAVRAWQAAISDDNYRDAIVLDCGGGTVDWRYLHRTESGMFRQEAALSQHAKIGSEVKIGGETVDEGLLIELVKTSRLPRDAFNTEVLRQHCRELKERYCRGLPLPKIEGDGCPVELEGSDIQAVINETFITPVCDAFKPYLDAVKKVTKRETPAVLLVGGSANLKGLEEALERELSCQVFKWHRAEFATVLGAALPVQTEQVQTEQPMLEPNGEDGQTETVYTLTKPNVLQVADEFLTLAAENDEKPAEFIRGQVEDYRSDAFRLVVVGEIKKGKSSFINALLEAWNLLPVETGVATSTVYEVQYGEEEKCTVRFNPREHSEDATQLEEVEPLEIPLGNVASYGTEASNPGNKREVESIVVELPNEFLKSGVTLIDTPGLGGMMAAHADITWKQAPKAHAVCFVLDSVEAVVSQPELESFSRFLKAPEKLGGSRPPFFFVQTKTDAAEEAWESGRDRNLEILSAHFDTPQKALHYFPVSSTLKAKACQSVSATSLNSLMLEDSGFPTLENFFWTELLREKEERSARKLLQLILDVTRAIGHKIGEELHLLQKTGLADLEELAQQATDTEGRLAVWEQETYPQLVTHFNTSADELRQETHAQLKNALDAEETGTIVAPIIAALRIQKLSRKELAEKSDALQQEGVAKCQEVTLNILERHREKLGALLERTTAELESSLEDPLASAEISLTPHEGEGPASSTSFWEKAAAVGVTTGGMLAGNALGVLAIELPIAVALGLAGVATATAAIVLAPVGLVTMVFGGRFALRKFRENRQEAALDKVGRFLSKVVQQARTQVLQHFEESSAAIEDKVRDFLEMAKTETAKELANRRNSIAAAQQQRTEEKQQTAAELEATAGQVAVLLQRIEQMLGTETRTTSLPNKS